MRNLYITILFCFLLVNTSFGQDSFAKDWEKVEKLELQGQARSASKIVKRIYKKAKRQDNQVQLIKSFMYKSRFALLLEQKGEDYFFSNFEQEIASHSFPANAILENMYGHFLYQYFKKHRYKIQQRSSVKNDSVPSDYRVWDVKTFMQEIHKRFQKSLASEFTLQKLPVDDFMVLLEGRKSSKKYYPTLYDILARNTFPFYKNYHLNYLIDPQMLQYDDNVFDASEKFINHSYSSKNSSEKLKNTTTILFQKLERLHQDRPEALVTVILHRLDFMYKNSYSSNKNKLYIKALKDLRAKYKHKEISAYISFQLVNHYNKISNRHDVKRNPEYEKLRIEAHRIASETFEQFPTSQGGLQCSIVLQELEQPSLSIKAEVNSIPNQPALAQVRFKSIDSLHLKVYSVPLGFLQKNILRKEKDSIILSYLKNREPITKKTYQLQSIKDYYDHTTEIAIPALPKGSYLLIAYNTNDINNEHFMYAVSVVNKTNLAVFKTDYNDKKVYHIVDRHTGTPIQKAKIMVFNKKETIKQKLTTDRFGVASIRKRKYNRSNNYSERYVTEQITHKEDTLLLGNSHLNYRTESDDDEYEWEARPFIFMDRSIYRPGQTIHFKSIVLQRKNKETSVVPNVYFNVVIRDANYTTLKEFRLRTNEYGSLSGSFKLPKTGTTGEYSVEVEEDSDYEDDDHPFWDYVDFRDIKQDFRVEAYKKPRFEIVLDPITKNFKLNDSIHITGKAKALLGSSVTNAKVEFTVYRRFNYSYHDKKFITEKTIQTDEKGNFTLSFFALPDDTPEKNVTNFKYDIELEVTDINGEVQTAEKTVVAGYKNYLLNVNVPYTHSTDQKLRMQITSEDWNQVPVTSKGTFTFYKLKSPDRVLRKRPWNLPEIKSISKEDFIKQFPHEQYSSSESLNKWKNGKEAAAISFDTKKDNILEIAVNNWTSGSYRMKGYGIDKYKDTVYFERVFKITNPKDQYLADKQFFDASIINSAYKKDGFAKLKLATALHKDLTVYVTAFYKGKPFYERMTTITKGSEILEIPVKQSYEKGIDINISYVRFNDSYTKQLPVRFPEIEKFLNIKTISYRNKLYPGVKETWSFNITDNSNKKVDAEILASMYDESLDQFVEHHWTYNDYFLKSQRYFYAPRVSFSGFANKNFQNYQSYYRRRSIPLFDKKLRFNWFGLSLNTSEYSYSDYIRRLQYKKKKKDVLEGSVTGVIVDETGLPLPGATISIKGTTTGTTTDFDGEYSIKANPSDVLMVSYVGYISQEINVGNKTSINVSLEIGNALEEVTVVAYGMTTKKSKVSSAIATVTSDSIEQVPIASLDQVLQGHAAGISVSTGSGYLGSSSSIIIRGRSSIKGDKQPLFVIDGVPVSQTEFRAMKPENIASLNVLKDTAATALYGSRGAGGVIIISTKYGTKTEIIDGKEVIVGLSEDDIPKIETRKKLKETAFFYPHLRTDKKGNISFSFEAPEALTRWKLQLFAHNKNALFGSVEKGAVTQKELMVIPNMPRFLREKDTITISAKIVNMLSNKAKGIASLRLFDALTMEPIDAKIHLENKNKAFEMAPKGNTSVSWKLFIPEGIEAVQYKVVATSGKFSDGEESALPVLTNRILVTEAESIWVKAGTKKSVTLNNLATNSSKTLKHHKLTLEYTSNPVWNAIQAMPYLMEYPYECAEQSFARYYANALAFDIMNRSPKIKAVFESWKANGQLVSDLEKNEELKSILIEETPWVRDAVSESEQKKRIAVLFDSAKLETQQSEMIAKLREMQNTSGGFPWFRGGRENSYITTHLLNLYAQMQKLNIKVANDYKLDAMMKHALKYADQNFYNYYKREMADSTNTTYGWRHKKYLYMRSGLLTKVPVSDEIKTAMEYYAEKLENRWLEYSLRDKAHIALMLYRLGRKSTAKKIMNSLDETAVKSEEDGMYWKENNRSWYYNTPVETHALLIEAFHEITNDKKIVSELQLWLLKQKQASQWKTTKATTAAIYALLLNPETSISLKDNTVFTIGKEKIKTIDMNASQKEAGTGYFKTSWNKEAITSDKATITIKNKSKSVGYGGIYWQYFEDLDHITQSDAKTLSIQKELYIRNKPTGEDDDNALIPIAKHQLKIGDVITVRLTIKNEEPIEYVHLKDMRASGLEPLDVLSEYKWQDGIGYYQSTKDASTNFFIDRLPKGVFILEYELRVNNSGTFSNGITTIQSMYAPEYTSHSKGIRIKTK